MSDFKNKYLPYLLTVVGYSLVARFILGGVLFSPGTFGFFHDWPLGPYPEMMHSWASNALYIWDSQLGNKIYPSDWLLKITFIPFSFLGGEVISKGLVVLLITLSGFSAVCLSRFLRLSWFSSFASGTIYIFSPIIFTKIIAGHLYYLLGYALAPLIVYSFLKGKEENKNRYFVIGGILLCFAISQIQFLVMIAVILLIFTLIDFRHIKRNIRGLLIIYSIAFLVVLAPIVSSQLSVRIPSYLVFDPSKLLLFPSIVSASDLLESFRLLGYEIHPYSYLSLGTPRDYFESNAGIIPAWVFYLDFILPIAGFLSLMLRRDKYTISFAVISLIGLFLLKGTNRPFGDLFELLFIAGLYLFREIWHIAFIYGFSITFLASIFLDKLQSYKIRSLFLKPLLPLALVTLIIISNGYPLLTTNFAGYLQTYNFPAEYETIYNSYSSNDGYNVLILPLFSNIRYDGLKLSGIDPLLKYSENQLLPTEVVSRPQTSMAIWLLSAMRDNKTDNIGQFLSGLGVKYVILRKDFNSNFIDYYSQAAYPDLRQKWYYSLEPFLNAQKDLTIISDTVNYKIYENTDIATKVFIPHVNVRGLSDFNNLLLISNLTSLSNVAVYPSNYSKTALLSFLDTPAEGQMPVNDFLDIGRYTNLTDPNNGWTNNKYWFGYSDVLDSRIHQGAFTSAQDAAFSFVIPIKEYAKGPFEIWIKALHWDKGGFVNFNIDGHRSSLDFFSLDQKFGLHKVFDGESDTDPQISIKNIDGANYVEGIYIRGKEDKVESDHYDKIKLLNVVMEDTPKKYLIPNPSFIYWQYGLPLNWTDPTDSCTTVFTCEAEFADGWRDNASLKISTTSNNNTWSWIASSEMEVKTNERYEVVTHMKANKFVSQSHIVVQGFNEVSKEWYPIVVCPAGVNGPMEWHMFRCEFSIQEDTTKIRLVLNAGWSSQKNQEAITLFDGTYLSKLSEKNHWKNLSQIRDRLSDRLSESDNATITEYSKINPTLYKVKINASQPSTLGITQSYDTAWTATVYKDGKKMGIYNSIPLYGVINAFELKETGNLDVEVRYTRQNMFDIGLIISATTLCFCGAFLIYDWKRTFQRSKVYRKSKIS